MNLQELLPDGGIEALASQLGISGDEARRGVEALLPSVLAGMGRDTQGLNSQIEALGGAGLADNVVDEQPTRIDDGNALLGGIFGSKDVSRQVAGHASQGSGLAPSVLKQMLPILVMLVAGRLAGRSQGQQGGLGGVLGSVLGNLGGSGRAAGGGVDLGGVLGSILGGARR